MAKPLRLTRAEWKIMTSVWDREPCTAPEVKELLFKETKWSYSTVRTVMDRMVVKGLLAAEKEGKNTLFRSAVTRARAQRGEVLDGLRTAFNGALTPMVQCLLDSADISDSELSELEALIKARKAGAK